MPFQGLSRDVGFRVKSLLISYFDTVYMCVCGAVCFLCFSMCSGVVGRLQDMWTGCRSVAKRMRGKQAEQDGVEEDVPGPEESQAEEDDADDGNDESGMQEEQGEEEQEKEQDPSIDPEGDEPLKRPAANPSKKPTPPRSRMKQRQQITHQPQLPDPVPRRKGRSRMKPRLQIPQQPQLPGPVP